MAIEARDRRARIGFGTANVLVSLAVAGGVFRLLPTRWWVVDGGAVIVSALLLASGVTLLRKMPIAETLTRVAAAIVLVLGLALVTAIFGTAGWLSGVYGQIGVGGAIVFGLVGALVLPYVVVLPAVELAWLGPRAAKPPAPEPEPEPPEPPAEEAEPEASSKKKRKKK
ncbi:MAG: hypothetical protein KIT84_04030 [Labilithrix sp.]|nr:hypothetical protein [Labilithrix sp.]MCW5810154.1 hypothetical protein [Labilithrix sp.]